MMPNSRDPDDLLAVQAEAAAEQKAVEVVRGEVADIGWRTVARAKARLAAYERVQAHYTRYIEDQAKQLEDGVFKDTPFKELGIARIIAQWIVESEVLFKEMEPLLKETPNQMRKGFLADSFERLPDEVRQRLLDVFNQKKQELMLWFVAEVQKALSEED